MAAGGESRWFRISADTVGCKHDSAASPACIVISHDWFPFVGGQNRARRAHAGWPIATAPVRRMAWSFGKEASPRLGNHPEGSYP
jgi:hypothetical protein